MTGNELYWVVRYQDGTSHTQIAEDGSENLYTSIQFERVRSFSLFSASTNRRIATLLLSPGDSFCFRRRNFIVAGGQKRVLWLLALKRAGITDPYVILYNDRGRAKARVGFDASDIEMSAPIFQPYDWVPVLPWPEPVVNN